MEEVDLDRIDGARQEGSWEPKELPGHGGLSVGGNREPTVVYLIFFFFLSF